MHQGGVRLCRAVLISIASAGFLAWAFCVSAVSPGEILISKIQITGGTGKTSEDYVSMYNAGTTPIDLNGMRLVKRTKTGTSDTILKSWTSETLINPGAYHVWANADFAATINADSSSTQTIANDNGVALRQGASGEIIDSVGWGEAANAFVEGSPFPVNPEGGQHIERKDNLDTNNNSNDFQIFPIEEEIIETEVKTETVSAPTGKDIIINELFVNPKELDGPAVQGEFIELYNKGTDRAALDDWRIEIGDIVYELPRGTTLAPGGFTSIRDFKNIPLPNNGATVKLFAPNRSTATQTISYKQAPDGFSYANFAAAWRWTAIPTPDKTNILAQAPKAAFDIIGPLSPNIMLRFDSSDSFTNNQAAHYAWDFGNGEISVEQYPRHSFSKNGKYTISLTVTTDFGSSEFSKTITIASKVNTPTIQPETLSSEAEQKVLGEKITIEDADIKSVDNDVFTSAGTAVSQPGSFGVQYFYFLPEFGEPLLQIYNSKKLFPKIEIGDQLIITGKYTERPEGPRLTTKEQKDITISGKGPIAQPELISSTELNKIAFPRLVTVEGTVGSKKSPRVFLSDEDGEIEVYLSAGTKLKVSEFTIGDKISVTGIVTISDGKPRIQPRSKDDIKKVANIEKITNSEDVGIASLPISPTALPETFQNNSDTPKKNMLLIYIVSGSVIVLGAIGYFLFKPH